MRNKILVFLMIFTSAFAWAESTRVVSCKDEYFTFNINQDESGKLIAVLTRNGRIDGRVRSTRYSVQAGRSKNVYQGTAGDVQLFFQLKLNGDNSLLSITFPDARSIDGVGGLTRGLGEGGKGISCRY